MELLSSRLLQRHPPALCYMCNSLLWGLSPWPYAYKAHALPAELKRPCCQQYNDPTNAQNAHTLRGLIEQVSRAGVVVVVITTIRRAKAELEQVENHNPAATTHLLEKNRFGADVKYAGGRARVMLVEKSTALIWLPQQIPPFPWALSEAWENMKRRTYEYLPTGQQCFHLSFWHKQSS